jgi:hypothetical protein
MTWPYRANLASSVITDGNDEVHFQSVRSLKFSPTFGVKTVCSIAKGFQCLHSKWVHCAFRLTSSRVSAKSANTFRPKNAFGQYLACSISGTKKQDVENLLRHSI